MHVCVRVCPWASTSEKLLRSLKELFHVIPSICLQKKKWDGSLGCSKGSKRPEVWSENYGASDSDPEVWP